MSNIERDRQRYEHFTKKGIYERRVRQYSRDIENFHPQSEPLFDSFQLRAKFEEFEEAKGTNATAYELFLFLMKQAKHS